MRAIPVPREDVGAVWPLVAPYLEAAAVRSNEDLERVRDWLESGHAGLWLGAVGDRIAVACVTALEDDCVVIWLLGGHLGDGVGMRRMLTLMPYVEAWARAWRRPVVEVREARPGWKRLLAAYGYDGETTLRKVL